MLSFNYSDKLIILIAAFTLIAANGRSETQSDIATDNKLDTLVTAEWLSQHIDDTGLVVLDCSVRIEMDESGGMRQVNGRTDYENGHIPTAGFADLMSDLCDVDSPMEFALPTPEQFCAAMGALGVGDDSLVVLYDGSYSVWAARVWWMLRWVGFDRAAVLDGGLAAWTAEARQLSTEPANRGVNQLTLSLRPTLIADRDEVYAAIDDNAVSLVDAMPKPHFLGAMALYGRPGHIPTASNVSTMALLGEAGGFRPHDELAAMFEGDRENRVISYCGSGIAASATAFVMSRLGFTDVAVYIASLQEWAADPNNPLVVDDP